MVSETRRFEYDKSTKNTYRYQEVTDDEPPAIGKIYVQKWIVDGQPPEEIEVTIEEP